MNTPTGGQSRHTPGDDREPALARHWYDIPASRLWRFVLDLVAAHSLRDVAEMAGLSKETVRKFISRIGDPKAATRKALGELYLTRFPRGAMASNRRMGDSAEGEVTLRTQLIDLLPRGEKEALATLSLIFDVAKRIPGHVSPRIVDAVQLWMELQVEGEYDAERFYARFKKRERQPRPQGEARKRKRAGDRQPEGDGET